MPDAYSSRPERIEAQMLTETLGPDAARWTGGSWDDGLLAIPTFEGVEYIEPGMYVVKDLETGRFRGMSDENFKKRYQYAGTGDSGEPEYTGMQFESEEDLQAHNQRKDEQGRDYKPFSSFFPPAG